MIAAPPLLARRRRPGATSWLIAAACLMMMLAAAAALALGRAASGLERAVASRLIVQVIEPDRARRDALAAEVITELRARRDVATMQRLSAHEIERLIGPYLGQAGLADLPAPALIDVTLAPGANVPALQAALGRIGPVTAEPAGTGLAPLAALIATLRGIALAIGAIAAAATGLVAILAARAAFAAEAPTISILHGLGATDGQIARAITGQVARDAAIGAAIGVALAGAAAMPLAGRMAGLGAGDRADRDRVERVDHPRGAADRVGRACGGGGACRAAGAARAGAMIRRLFATLVLLWALGFALFAVSLPGPAGDETTDGIVVLTGGPGRVQRGLKLLAAGRARRMLVSGVDRRVRARRSGRDLSCRAWPDDADRSRHLCGRHPLERAGDRGLDRGAPLSLDPAGYDRLAHAPRALRAAAGAARRPCRARRCA